MLELALGAARLRLLLGDITKVKADAIVNAANEELSGGGGVDGAIHRAGGPTIMLELNKLRPRGGCPTGSAVVTRAGTLQASWVVHAVGPVWRGGGSGEPALLAGAYETSLRLAAEKGARTVALPAISTGVYGYPLDKAAAVAVEAVGRGLAAHPSLTEAVFVLFDKPALAAFERAARARFPQK
jgi:O-acetyl-ADP-ribose deacetylase